MWLTAVHKSLCNQTMTLYVIFNHIFVKENLSFENTFLFFAQITVMRFGEIAFDFRPNMYHDNRIFQFYDCPQKEVTWNKSWKDIFHADTSSSATIKPSS